MGDHPRSRLVLAVLLVAMLFGGSPAALASVPSADDPVSTVDGFLDTFVAQDVPAYGQFLCAEKRDAFIARFDGSAFLGSLPAGVDGSALLAAITMELTDRAVTLLESSDATASVALRGRFLMQVEDAAAREFIRQILTAQGRIATEEVIERTLPELLTAIGGAATSEAGQAFDRTARLIVEDGLWVICDDEFGFADAQSPTPGSSAPGSPTPGSSAPSAGPIPTTGPSPAG